MRRNSQLLRSADPARLSRQCADKAGKAKTHRVRPVFDPQQAARLLLSGTMPNNAIVTGSLSLTGCSPIFAPGLRVKGNLMIVECQPQLAPGMVVEGIADFFSSLIRSLQAFTVRLNLGLLSTGIAELPKDLKVGGNIYVDQNAPKSLQDQATALSNNPEAKKPAKKTCSKSASKPRPGVRNGR